MNKALPPLCLPPVTRTKCALARSFVPWQSSRMDPHAGAPTAPSAPPQVCARVRVCACVMFTYSFYIAWCLCLVFASVNLFVLEARCLCCRLPTKYKGERVSLLNDSTVCTDCEIVRQGDVGQHWIGQVVALCVCRLGYPGYEGKSVNLGELPTERSVTHRDTTSCMFRCGNSQQTKKETLQGRPSGSTGVDCA